MGSLVWYIPVGKIFQQLPNFFEIFKTSVTTVANPKFEQIYPSLGKKWLISILFSFNKFGKFN